MPLKVIGIDHVQIAVPKTLEAECLAFYREALAHYVEGTLATLSLTIDRSFSRFG